MIIWLLTSLIAGIIAWNMFAIYAIFNLDGKIYDICDIYFKTIYALFWVVIVLGISYGLSYSILHDECEAKGNDAKYCEAFK